METTNFIKEALALNPLLAEYAVGQRLKELFPTKHFIESDEGYFDVENFAGAGLCTLHAKPELYQQILSYWREPEPDSYKKAEPKTGQTFERGKNTWYEVEWEGKTLEVLHMTWNAHRYWIFAESKEVALDFFTAVCTWTTEIRGEVLVFDGHWYKDEYLYQDIQNSTFDNLILRGTLKQEIQDDLTQFFASRALYEEYGIPWKRGILFIGPPGNGKTHAVKALINAIQQPCLYIKSLNDVQQVFYRARRTAPCILVMEDLESQLQPHNRSAFLNELDGFAANIGIVTLATTNHPERLDPAILDRPSRFDRKYHFELPALAERHAYIRLWNQSLKPALRLGDEEIERIGEQSEDFSFAYLKELFLSSMMQWISFHSQKSFAQVMLDKIVTLREQMPSEKTLEGDEDYIEHSPYARRMPHSRPHLH